MPSFLIDMIYKYYSPTDYAYDALEKGYLFFNKVSRQNDPSDASFKLLQADYIKDSIKQVLPADAEEIMKSYATCSFSKVKSNKHMWAFYAKEYSGFVIGYDENKLKNISEEYLARIPMIEVTYSDNPITDDTFGNTFTIKNLSEPENKNTYCYTDCMTDIKAVEALFLYMCSLKEKEVWSMEEEVRLIIGQDVINRKDDLEKKGIVYSDTGYKIPIPKGCVKEIILGHNYKEADFCKIKSIANRHGISIIKQTKLGNPFNLDFEDITEKVL